MNLKRRRLLQAISAILASAPSRLLYGQSVAASSISRDNFQFIYGNSDYREEFKTFLVNVFHLYPEDELHELIAASARPHAGDALVYADVQARLDAIKPFLGDFFYALPALGRQKEILAEQSATLADTSRRYDGYLELGTNGRYLDSLEERFKIQGERYVVSDRAPGHSLIDIIDRGQIPSAGEFIPLSGYRTEFASRIPRASIE